MKHGSKKRGGCCIVFLRVVGSVPVRRIARRKTRHHGHETKTVTYIGRFGKNYGVPLLCGVGCISLCRFGKSCSPFVQPHILSVWSFFAFCLVSCIERRGTQPRP